MAVEASKRADIVAQNLEQVPDEAYLGLSVASIFTAMALFLVGKREEALFVGLLGTAFASVTLTLKLLATERSAHQS